MPPVSLTPTVGISPASGPPGSNVFVSAANFPPNARVVLGLGRVSGEFTVTYVAQTDPQGSLNVQVQIPSYVQPEQPWVAVVQAPGGEIQAASGQFFVTNGGSPPAPTPAPTPTQTLFSSASIYLVALNDNGASGPMIGCGDSIVAAQVQFAPTVAPLTAALQQLLSNHSQFYGQSGLYNALYQSDLTLTGVNIVDGEAIISLTGTVRLGGVCDAPRVASQLEQTALQYTTVNRVTITVNGQPLQNFLTGQS
jgi:hypothetical protein